MGWKCVPQVMGLVRGDGMRRDGKGQAKHRANAAAIIHEAFEIADQNDGHPIPIRKSASETYDRSRTPNNRYVGYRTADDVIAALEEEAAAQTVEVQTKDKKTGETVIRKRPLRSDAVIGVAVIFKPPCAIARTWSREQYDKFINDSLDVMAAVQCGGEVDRKTGKLKRGQEPCRLFRRENIIAGAEHWDEGSLAEGEDVYTGHWHKIYKPEDEAGKYRGNLIDPYFLSRLSATYPRMMRERGWAIEECDCTDWEKFNDDKNPENKGYKAKRKSKIREGGKSVNKYIASAERDAVASQYDDVSATLEQAGKLMRDAEAIAEAKQEEAAQAENDKAEALRQKQVAEEAKAALDADMESTETELNRGMLQLQLLNQSVETAKTDMTTSQQELESVRAEAVNEINELEKSRNSARNDAQKAKAEAKKAKAEAESAQAEAEAAKAEATKTKAEVEAAKADRDAARKEADDLRRDAVAKAELAGREAAKAMQAKIEADAREAWKGWLDSKKRQAEAAAAKIIEDAKARAAEMIAAAAEAAQGEYAFLLKWLDDPHQRYKTGESFLDVARAAHMREIRKRRMSAIPPEARDAGRGRQTGTGRTGPEG